MTALMTLIASNKRNSSQIKHICFIEIIQIVFV